MGKKPSDRRIKIDIDKLKEILMTLDRAVLAFAGIVVLAGVALSMTVHPLWIWLSAFAGANMIQAAFTGFCPAAMIFKKLGIKPGTAFR
jgi:hypothetical protein